MLSRTTLLTVFALCGTCIMRADPPSIDPTALAAVQYTFIQSFGPGATCKFPDTLGLCLATVPFVGIPNGQRFVIQDISASVVFNANGGTDVLEGAIGILLSVGGTVANYTFPFDRSQVVVQGTSTTTYYYMNKNVKIYADPVIGFGWQINNLNYIGPIFQTGTGGMTITVSGYLVPNK